MESSLLVDYLNRLSVENPANVIRKLSNGSLVSKSMGTKYLIDDVNLDKRLGEFPVGTIPYGPIYRKLQNSFSGIMGLFSGRDVVPFSEAFNAELGECLEKSVLVQMAAQRGGTGFLINGALDADGDGCVGCHAYNLLARDNQLYLIDVQNPLAVESNGQISGPYIAPVTNISGEFGEISTSKEWERGRKYFLI